MTGDVLAGPGRLVDGRVAVTLGVVVAVGLRWWVLRGPLGRVDGDEAVVGLMGMAFAHGHVSAMFWGQNYGGAIEPATTGLTFFVLGPSRWALKLVPMIFAASSGLVLWRIARLVLHQRVAAFAGALLLVYPPFSVWWSTKARGIYWSALLLVLLGMLFAIRYVDAGRRGDLFAFGVFTGLGWWANPQTIFVFVPLAVWLAVRSFARWRDLWSAAAGMALGALPWLWWNAHHSWASVAMRDRHARSTYLERLRLFTVRSLPQALGLRMPYTGRWLLGPVGPLLYAAALVGFGFFAVSFFRGRRGAEQRWEPILIVMLAYPLVYSVPIQTVYTGEPRFLQLLIPFVILLLCRVLVTPTRQLIVLAAALTLSASVLGALATTTNREAALKEAHPPDVTLLTRVLRREHIRAVHAGYWVAYPISFDSQRTILADSLGVVRDRAAKHRASQVSPSAYVVLRGSRDDARLAARLNAARDPYHRSNVAQFAVYRVDHASVRSVR
ncbi:MAG: glycosyltransferase family 39 protein [Acidimicrobiia bacterium]